MSLRDNGVHQKLREPKNSYLLAKPKKNSPVLIPLSIFFAEFSVSTMLRYRTGRKLSVAYYYGLLPCQLSNK